MKVFVVFFGEYSSRYASAAFSSEELAKDYAHKMGDGPGCEDIDEFEVDERAADVCKTVYKASIDLESGDIFELQQHETVVHPTKRGDTTEATDWRTHSRSDYVKSFGRLWAAVESYVSADHAIKLAAEYRQDYLRRADR